MLTANVGRNIYKLIGFHITGQRRLASTHVRVRFAPSPTGHLHLGGLRTALYNYLFARQNNGRFILRIEDTDRSRLVPGATEKIIEDLTWIGIRIDEGPNAAGQHGPYFQSQRLNIYNEYINKLLKTGHAYHCFCTEKRLDLLRKEAVKNRQIAKYDNRCRGLKADEASMRIKRGDPYCIRFKLNTDESCCQFNDLIYGNITYDVMKNEGDPIIVKSDGFPTYHIANVIDDHLMEITHVMRGVEWQISTTKHLMMYKAFDWKPPLYGHLPLLVDSSGHKLSKRTNDTQIQQYRESGVFPNALVNFVTTSGGGFIHDQENGIKPRCYNLSQLTLRFNIGNIKSSPGKFDGDRLMEYNRLELENMVRDDASRAKLVKSIQSMVKIFFAGKNDALLQINQDHVDTVLKWSINRINKLSDLLGEEFLYLWSIPDTNLDKFEDADIEIVRTICDAIEKNQFYLNKQVINRYFQQLAFDCGYNYSDLMKLVRSLLSGLKAGPSVAEMLVILGRENALLRLKMFLEMSAVRNKRKLVWPVKTISKQ